MKIIRLSGIALILGLTAACSSVPSAPRQPSTPVVHRVTPTPTPAPTPEPTPLPIATPPPPPPPPDAAALPETDLDPPLIRVLLRKAPEIVLPGTGRPWFLSSKDQSGWLWGPLKISSAGGGIWWQLGAFAKEEGAEGLVKKLKAALGEDVRIDTVTGDDGLYRVRVLHGPEGKDFLASAGFPGAVRVYSEPRLRVEGSGGAFESTGEILLRPAGDESISLGSGKYRGRMIARIVSGKVLLINELNLESYLRGVVPGEMGPSAFPALEALKAQAVAARTYAVAHLGDHRDQGYDICATPACQVYGGAGIEHPLTSRAVSETSGIIATWEGKPIDAMYTSTCGGHTEDSTYLFSGREAPYLKGVDCAFDRAVTLRGDGERSEWMTQAAFRAELARKSLGLEAGVGPRDILHALAVKRGLEVKLPETLKLDDFAGRLLKISGLEGAAQNLSRGKTPQARLLFLADLFKAPLSPPPVSGWEFTWALEAAESVMEVDGILRKDRGELLADRDAGARIFPKRADDSEELPGTLPLWEAWGDSRRRRRNAEILPGAALSRYRDEDGLVALVFSGSGGSGEADRRSAWREWVRDVSVRDLARRIGMPGLKELRITKRAPSRRVIGLEAVDDSGRRKSWTGFRIRRVLDLPETLFDMLEFTGPGGEKMLRFLGRGWGHGVGLCQNGAYGLARAGKSYDEILRHYYSGISLERIP